MNVLRVDSSPRTIDANSRILADYLVNQLDASHVNIRDLAAAPLPRIKAEDLVALHASTDVGTKTFQQHLKLSNTLIEELKVADTLVLGVAMHNFSVPAVLKQWIDYICRAGHTFKYTEQGPEGLTGIDRAFLIVATGGTPIGSDMDFASGYLKHICQFIGVKDIQIIDASGSKRKALEVIARGKNQIDVHLKRLAA